jgi:hypothetical protein
MSTEKPKKPTLREKVQVYEALLHNIQMHREVTMNSVEVIKLLDKIGNWSYAHRQGNGEPTEAEQQRMVNRAFWRLDE